MPYRLDIRTDGRDTADRAIELGALDVELNDEGGMALLLPDALPPERVADLLGVSEYTVSPAVPRDAGSVWTLGLQPIHVGRLWIVPAGDEPRPGTLRLLDTRAFGTGRHPTTALCLEALIETVEADRPEAVLDVGTGSGVLALAALTLGIPRALGIDVDDEALQAAAENARINGLEHRLQLARGGPDSVDGRWPLVLANLLAAPLVEMAPALASRLGHRGQLVLSGFRCSLERDVEQAYRRAGLRRVRGTAREGWAALVLQATW